jgi:hypothetical protein
MGSRSSRPLAADRKDFVSDLRRLNAGQYVVGVSTTKHGYRQVDCWWLGQVADRMERLEGIVESLVRAWDSVPENVQVPEEINVDELWAEARDAIDPNK